MTLHFRLKDWRRRQRESRELACLGSTEFSNIARDLRLAPAELGSLARGRGPSPNLSDLLDGLGIDRATTSRAEPAAMRDMERVCASSPLTSRRDRDLKARLLSRSFRAYCPNRATIEALEPERVR